MDREDRVHFEDENDWKAWQQNGTNKKENEINSMKLEYG